MGCDVPGCIVVSQPPCDDCIPVTYCAPLRGLQCEPTCRAPQPDCGPDMVPEIRDGCFTGDCVHRSWCLAEPPFIEP